MNYMLSPDGSAVIGIGATGNYQDLPDSDPRVVAWASKQDKDDRNAPIYAALDELDRKSIRPAREGDTARLAALEVQAAALRSQLVK